MPTPQRQQQNNHDTGVAGSVNYAGSKIFYLLYFHSYLNIQIKQIMTVDVTCLIKRTAVIAHVEKFWTLRGGVYFGRFRAVPIRGGKI